MPKREPRNKRRRPARPRTVVPKHPQQSEALSGLQDAAGLEATTAAGLVGLSYPMYNRYLWGQVPLRTDQIPVFAKAFRVSTADLTRALGLMDDEVDPALLERINDAMAPLGVPESTRREAAKRLAEVPTDAQDDILGELVQMSREQQPT